MACKVARRSLCGIAFNLCSSLKEVLLENGSKLTSGQLGVNESIIGTYWNEDNLTWTLTADGTMTISGSGAMKNYNNDNSPATQKKDNVKKVVIEDEITSIGNYAFEYCSGLTSITIPDSVTSIGNYAFESCGKLASITIPKSVTSIGAYAFSGTPWLTNKQKDNSLVIVNGILIDGTACSGKVTIPDGVTSIGEGAFYNCSSLTSIEIPEGVTSIGDYAFGYCSSLASIEIPSSVTSIGDYAFSGCSSLTDITIPGSVTNIGVSAFSDCTGLTSVTIPKSVVSIGSNVFDGCTALTEVLLEGGSTLTSDDLGVDADKVVTHWNEGNLTWTLTADGTMTISGTGAMKEYYDSDNSPAYDNSKMIDCQVKCNTIREKNFEAPRRESEN